MLQPEQQPLSAAPVPSVAGPLLFWYDRHARALPWRVSPESRTAGTPPEPYRIWLSEVMLQQTTVATVKSYFARFVDRWPTVGAVAAAPETDILGEWAGLGYYARARNLHACAKTVTDDFDGCFPRTAAELRALPGIGEYTSAAIAAIAFDEPVAVVDGNVERVVTRLFAIEAPLPGARKTIRAHVAALTPDSRPGDFAQAMMDLGATVCTPTGPACILCPLRVHCRAATQGRAAQFPVKKPKAAPPERKGAAFVAVRPADGAIWLRRRARSGMLGGMSEPPTTEWSARADGATGAEAAPFAANWRYQGAVTHGFTHFRLELEVYRAELTQEPPIAGWWSNEAARGGEALPTLMRKVLDRALADPAEPRQSPKAQPRKRAG
ncbi:A/G-specific adenine glycosylase [Aurantimonas marianensis]|uniref:Adenine DNA glycosylase n=1 Tax=Aurantimonas marianensis TaxID=2920428 RepID=A0A9X2HFV2_9HYPH|nr:A/G-specific adenine glycosylase [Aurantimonas marianensis]MCP3056249.1 A/G-specific adenine glycosylase [Aurantimonas marianensis]